MIVSIELPVSVRLPRVVVESAPDPLPRSTVLACMLFHPVPPLATCRIPATSDERLTRAAEMAPEADLRMPERLPNVNPFETTRFVLDATPVMPIVVEVAFVKVELPETLSVLAEAVPR